MGSEPIRIDFVCGTPVKVSESGGFLSGLTCWLTCVCVCDERRVQWQGGKVSCVTGFRFKELAQFSVCDSDAHDLLESDLVSMLLMLTLDSVTRPTCLVTL